MVYSWLDANICEICTAVILKLWCNIMLLHTCSTELIKCFNWFWHYWSRQQIYYPWSHFFVMFYWRMKGMIDLLFFNLHLFLGWDESINIVVLINFRYCHGNEKLHISIYLTYLTGRMRLCSTHTWNLLIILRTLLRAAQKMFNWLTTSLLMSFTTHYTFLKLFLLVHLVKCCCHRVDSQVDHD